MNNISKPFFILVKSKCRFSWCLKYPFIFTQSESTLSLSNGRVCVRNCAVLKLVYSKALRTWLDSYDVTHSSSFHKLVSLGYKDGTLSVPVEILDSLLSPSNDCKDVVQQLKDKFNLDQVVLRDPDPDKMKLTRYLAKKANIEGRYDVIKELRSLVPAGITGRFAFKTFPTV